MTEVLARGKEDPKSCAEWYPWGCRLAPGMAYLPCMRVMNAPSPAPGLWLWLSGICKPRDGKSAGLSQCPLSSAYLGVLFVVSVVRYTATLEWTAKGPVGTYLTHRPQSSRAPQVASGTGRKDLCCPQYTSFNGRNNNNESICKLPLHLAGANNVGPEGSCQLSFSAI